MSKIYVDLFESGGEKLYGLFFIDSKERVQHLCDDFRPISFRTEAEAKAKLNAIEDEKRREDAAVAFSIEDANFYAQKHKWKFATTYAKTAPHEYLVKKWLGEEDRYLYERFVQTMKDNSVLGYFYEHENKYLILGDYYYWYMETPENMAVDLINRTTVDYLEFRDGAYYYKPKD